MIDLSKYKTDFVKIKDRSPFILGPIPQLHRFDEARYYGYWRPQKKNCVEGFWGEQPGGWRYMPGRLYFYGNFGSILIADEITKQWEYKRPSVDDLEWELSYYALTADGFSGFQDDEWQTCYRKMQDLKPSDKKSQRFATLVAANGQWKEYVNAMEYLKTEQKGRYGLPLYLNDMMNMFILGSRSSGKSIGNANMLFTHDMIFDGAKYYDYSKVGVESRKMSKILVGGGQSSKTEELFSHAVAAMKALYEDPSLGVYGKPGDRDHFPTPFYRDMKGVNQKEFVSLGDKWIYYDEERVDGRTKKVGTGSFCHHINYSINKKTGSQSGASGRYNIIFYEEIGLMENIEETWGSNDAAVKAGNMPIGRQVGIGTSGNLKTIKATRKMFLNPSGYNIVPQRQADGTMTGFFIPAFMIDRRNKDENGNTNYEVSIQSFLDELDTKHDAKNMNLQKMNYPLFYDDMFLSEDNIFFDAGHIDKRITELLKGGRYVERYTPVELFADPSERCGVGYRLDKKREPILSKQYHDRVSLDAPVLIYQFPQLINGITPNDMYIVGHDPNVIDHRSRNESLASTYVILHPKYTALGFDGGRVVAELTCKCPGGKLEYYRRQELLIQMYGNPIRGLWFEHIRGEYCRAFYIKKGKEYLLNLRPGIMKGNSTKLIGTSKYGWGAQNMAEKIALIEQAAEFTEMNAKVDDKRVENYSEMLEEIDWDKLDKEAEELRTMEYLTNLDQIDSLFLLRDMRDFDLEENSDGVLAYSGGVLGIMETSAMQTMMDQDNSSTMDLSILSHNPKIWGGNLRRKLKGESGNRRRIR